MITYTPYCVRCSWRGRTVADRADARQDAEMHELTQWDSLHEHHRTNVLRNNNR